MRTDGKKTMIEIMLPGSISFNEREASFLRVMAEHCVATKLAGYAACEDLIKALDRLGIPVYGRRPTYGIFEEEKG